MNGFLCKLEGIRYGVPQGSCLGTLLYVLYISGLRLAYKKSKVTLYADNTIINFSTGSVDDISRGNERGS